VSSKEERFYDFLAHVQTSLRDRTLNSVGILSSKFEVSVKSLYSCLHFAQRKVIDVLSLPTREKNTKTRMLN
jgi:hypothetical protein